MRERLKPLHGALRGWPMLLVVLATFLITVGMNPVKLGIFVAGLCKISMGAYVGYWAARAFLPDPDTLSGVELGTAWKVIGWCMAAGIVGAGMIP